MDPGISSDDDWPIRAVIVVVACLAGVASALMLLMMLAATFLMDEDHGGWDPTIPTAEYVALFGLPAVGLLASATVWYVRWRRVLRVALALVALLTPAGWYVIQVQPADDYAAITATPVRPPSTSSTMPWTKADSSLAR